MPEGQKEKRITCVSCGRLLATGAMSEGSITIRCKCGVDNTIQARQKLEGRNLEFINVNTSASVARRWP